MAGNMTPKSLLGICHTADISIVGEISKVAAMKRHIAFVIQKCLRILGNSIKKLDGSTSFFVAPKVTGNENMYESMAIIEGTLTLV